MASQSSSKRSEPDHFGLLGLAPRFDVDTAVLEAAFFERTKELHPDRFATAPVAERVAALSRSRALNDAYSLLKRETSRAEYLLAQEGLAIGDNERIDPALVMDLLEQREQLAAERQRGNLGEVERLQTAMKRQRTSCLERVRALFRQAEAIAGAERAAVLADIKGQLILLRYVERYLEECDAALDED